MSDVGEILGFHNCYKYHQTFLYQKTEGIYQHEVESLDKQHKRKGKVWAKETTMQLWLQLLL